MKAYSLFIYVIGCICRYTSIDIKPELRKNVLKFGYGINYKYEGISVHSFDRFYVVTKFTLPTTSDINFSKLEFNNDCEYLRKRNKGHNPRKEQCISDLIAYCRKIKQYVYFYKQQINSLNDTAHELLNNEIDIILPKFLENSRETRDFYHTYIRIHRFSL